ncbi:MAG: DUF3575 domain-containing protein [Prolixibacteraceae bacterium]|nr:DUF3575 domain-containing protein [Prolixibacteraceae bacterium]
MKKIYCNILLLLLISFWGYSQQNNIKVGLLGASIGSYNLGYEREITDASTMNLNVGYWNTNIGLVQPIYYFDRGEGVWLDQMKYGLTTSLEYRFYTGSNHAMKGLYLSPYLRFWNHSMVFQDYIENDQVPRQLFNIRTKLSSVGLGFQMGYQWLINDKVSIDWYFIGAGLERAFINASYVLASNNSFNYQLIEGDVREVFEGFGLLERNLMTRDDPERLKIELPVWMPGLRTGLSVGFAF